MIPDPLDAVIFDMDGLLLDTERLYRKAIFAACADLGFEMTDPVHRSLIGTPKETGDASLIAYFGADFRLDHYHTACTAHFAALAVAGIPLRPGAPELLSHLQAEGVPMAVATSTARTSAEPRLRQAGVFDMLGAVVTRSDVARGKPDPETFLAAAHALGARPSRCLALEDSHNGVRAAAAAGMATIMVPDLLEPTAEIEALCAGVLPSLLDVRAHLIESRRGPVL